MTDLRTPIQKQREARAKKVYAMYNRLAKNSNGSKTAIIERISKELSANPDTFITSMGVRYILKKEGLI